MSSVGRSCRAVLFIYIYINKQYGQTGEGQSNKSCRARQCGGVKEKGGGGMKEGSTVGVWERDWRWRGRSGERNSRLHLLICTPRWLDYCSAGNRAVWGLWQQGCVGLVATGLCGACGNRAAWGWWQQGCVWLVATQHNTPSPCNAYVTLQPQQML